MIKPTQTFVIFSLLALLPALAFAWAAVVPEKITVGSDTVTLADLYQAPDGLDKAEAARVMVCQSPPPGRQRVLNGHFIKNRFAHAGIKDVVVPEQVIIERAAGLVPMSALRKVILKRLSAIAGEDASRLNVTFISGLSDVQVPLGAVELRVDLSENEDLRGRMMVPVEIFVDGEKIDTRRIDVEASLEVEVWTAKYNLPRGKVITTDHVTKTLVNLTETRGRPYRADESIIGMRVTRTVPGGAVLVSGMVEKSPLVKKGDVVTIIVRDGAVTVKTFGIVQKTANLQAMVPVVNLDSGIKIFARVVDKSTVCVTYN